MNIQKPVVSYSYIPSTPQQIKAVIDDTAIDYPAIKPSDNQGHDFFVLFYDGNTAHVNVPDGSEAVPIPENASQATCTSTFNPTSTFLNRKAINVLGLFSIPLESTRDFVGRVFDYTHALINDQVEKTKKYGFRPFPREKTQGG